MCVDKATQQVLTTQSIGSVYDQAICSIAVPFLLSALFDLEVAFRFESSGIEFCNDALRSFIDKLLGIQGRTVAPVVYESWTSTLNLELDDVRYKHS